MKIIKISILLLCSAFILSSCQDKESNLDKNDETIIKTTEETLSERRICAIDFNDTEASVGWTEDCTIATFNLSVCCDCNLQIINATGCTTTAGELYVQIESCPFTFEDFYFTVYPISIISGSCYNIVFEAETFCERANISAMQFNGMPVDWDIDYTTINCP